MHFGCVTSSRAPLQARYTDFSPREEYPAFMTAPQVLEYLNDYATHFKLRDHVELNTAVVKVERNKDDTQWLVHTAENRVNVQVREFYKVVFATGIYNVPCLPVFEGADLFKGKKIHSQAFKRCVKLSQKALSH